MVGMKQTTTNHHYAQWVLTTTVLGLAGEFFLGRNDLPWTLWVGLACLALSVGFFLGKIPYPRVSRDSSRKTAWLYEWTVVGLLVLLGVFFRWHKLDRIPSGIFIDEASWGWGAERILYEGWRPLYDHQFRPFYETLQLGFWEMWSYYLLAFWFWIFEPSRFSLYSFSNIFSLLGGLLAYGVFRQWGDRRAAWLALFFMVTLRWYLNFSRCAHPAYDVPFYLCGTLALWLWAHRTDRLWVWWGCGLFLSAGFYAYPALLAMPLLLALWAFYEWKNQPSERPRLFRRYAVGSVLALCLSFPIWLGMLLHRSFGMREEQDWFFSTAHSGSVESLGRHFFRFLMIFDRQGDSWPVHNWPNYRMLDPVTGFLFLLGMVLALRSFKERPYFYCLSGLGVMALPGLLTVSDAPVSHITGMIPFIVYLAARAFLYLWDNLRLTNPILQRTAFCGALLLLGGMAGSNFYDYFYRQGTDTAVISAFYPNDTAVGERVSRGTEKKFFLSPRFFGNFDVEFLAYRKISKFRELVFWNLPSVGRTGDGDILFALDEGKTGFLQLLQKTYPQGSVETYEYVKGWPLVYFYRVPAGSAQWNGPLGGLRGVYRLSGDWSGTPVLVRKDPILNFTFRNDFGLADFKTLAVRWTGLFQAPQSGSYSFLALTTDQSAVWVDGKKILEGSGTKEGVVNLASGSHRIQVDFQKLSGVDTAFNLLWKLPGSPNYQIIPFWQWGSSAKTPIPTAKP